MLIFSGLISLNSSEAVKRFIKSITMNIILAEQNEITNHTLILTDRRAEHLVKVLRVQAGDTVRVGLINGPKGKGKVSAVKTKYPFSVSLLVAFKEESVKPANIDLILALPRPIMLKRILSQMSALGVGEIHLVNAKRVEKSFWNSNILKDMEYQDHLLQGLEQAVDTIVPKVFMHLKFKPFVEDYLPAHLGSHPYKILANPLADHTLSSVIKTSEGRVIVAVGPEGGWIDYEVEKFCQQGFCCCSMGQRILKVDTATVALHSRISAVREMLAG